MRARSWRLTLMATAIATMCVGPSAAAQSRRRAPRRPATARPTIQPARVTCPSELGIGASTKRRYCDVLIEFDPANGIVVEIPAHVGDATLIFDLHNRHTYSEELVRTGRAFSGYTAIVNVASMDGTMVGQAAIQSEFRGPDDLDDRILGGAQPDGLKAVAPTGTERIRVSIPARIDLVSIVGQKLVARTLRGEEAYTLPGRPVAIISNIQIEYRPRPEPRRRR
ncbi:MAG: hypothetical protein HYX76_14235 [Acidobacteria bacterium]|nr:hypothetical protein [Acidobacteriota bacterium]